MAQSCALCQCSHAPTLFYNGGASPNRQNLKSQFKQSSNAKVQISTIAKRIGRSRRTSLRVFSEQRNTPSGGSDPGGQKDGEKSSINWDGAWSSFTKSIQGGQKQMESYVDRPQAGPPPKFARKEKEDDTRRIENAALDVWTDERFFKVGVVVVGLFLLFVVVVVGPPPR